MATAEETHQIKEQIDGAFADARAHAPSPEAFERQIKASGMTLDQLRDQAIEEQLCRRVILRETTNHITVTETEIKKFYDDNPTKFEVPEQVHAAHILISTLDPLTHEPLAADKKKEKEKLASDLRARALKGDDFAALAKQYSETPAPRTKAANTLSPAAKWCPNSKPPPFLSKPTRSVSWSKPATATTSSNCWRKPQLPKLPWPRPDPRIREYLIGQAVKDELPAYTAKLKAGADVKLTDASPTTAPAGKK